MSSPEDSDYEARMSFTEHLGELRIRIIRAGIALLVSVIACFIFSDPLINLLRRPLEGLETAGIVRFINAIPGMHVPGTPDDTPATPEDGQEGGGQPAQGNDPAVQGEGGVKWTVLSPLEPILIKVKVASYFGILFALPFVLYQGCAFIFPGLLPRERKVVQFIIMSCSLLAIAGVAVAYLFVFPLVMPYLLEYVPAGVEVQLRMSETLDIIIKGLIAFAVAFQFPMVVLVLVFMGLLSPQALRDYRRVTIVVIAVVSAVLTPPDPVSLIIMMIPLCLLYEVSIWASYLVVRRQHAPAPH